MKLKQYPKYKDSNLPWAEQVPNHWDIFKVKHRFKLVKIPSTEGNPTVLSLTQKGIKIRDISKNEGQLAQSYSGYNTIKPGDICFNPMDLQSGAAARSQYHGVISNAYYTVRPYDENKINTKFYGEYFNIHFSLKIFYPFGKGVGRPKGSGGRWTLSKEDFMGFKFICPPKEEQDKIAQFLSFKFSQINKFIRNKRRLIQLLKEQKQAIINQAITRGINLDAKMKPSGIDWLGNIPGRWECFKVKRLVRFSPSKSEVGNQIDMENIAIFLPMETISVDGKINCEQKQKIKDMWSGFTYFKRNDVVMAKITPCFENGKGAYLSELETDFGFGTTELIVMRPSKSIMGEFLYFFTMTSKFRKDGEEMMTGAAGQKRVPTDFVKNYIIALPPVNEQEKIIEFIKIKSTELDRVIEKTKSEIKLIQEYRTRLISDVVTGKVDVRDLKVEDVTDGEITDDLDSSEDDQEPGDSVEEVLDEE